MYIKTYAYAYTYTYIHACMPVACRGQSIVRPYLHTCICIHMYIYTCMHACSLPWVEHRMTSWGGFWSVQFRPACICECMYVCIFCMYVYVWFYMVCMWSMYLSLPRCVNVCVYMCVCKCIYVHVYAYACVWVWSYDALPTAGYRYASMYICTCICICICVRMVKWCSTHGRLQGCPKYVFI